MAGVRAALVTLAGNIRSTATLVDKLDELAGTLGEGADAPDCRNDFAQGPAIFARAARDDADAKAKPAAAESSFGRMRADRAAACREP